MASGGSGEAPRPAPRTARVRDRAERYSATARRRYEGSAAQHLWKRLDSVDFVNRGMLFAAILLLCFIPFLIVANALAGRSAAAALARHLGLNHEAAHDVSALFAPATATSSAVTGASYVFFVLGGVAAAAAVQDLYERVFELEGRGVRDLLRRLAWLGVLIGCSALAGWAGRAVHGAAGPVALAVLGLASFVGFWWFTMWFLLGGRIPWRQLMPAAFATGICWLGMEVVFSFVFSSTVISNEREYGPIGVVFALMSYMIAIGVVIILGAVFGLVWRERELSVSGAVRGLRGRSRRRGSGGGAG